MTIVPVCCWAVTAGILRYPKCNVWPNCSPAKTSNKVLQSPKLKLGHTSIPINEREEHSLKPGIRLLCF